MYILGIESSCDETAVSISKDGTQILSSVVSTQIEEHKKYGGVVPEIASRRHCENILGVVREAVAQSGITLEQVDAIAVTYAPGLIGALLVGVSFAKGLAMATGSHKLHFAPGFETALSLSCRKRRTQSYSRSP